MIQGPESEELAAASKQEDAVNFYQTTNPEVVKLFHMDPDAKRPALVMVKSEDEKLSYFGMFQNFVTLVWCSKLKTVGKQ